VIARVHSIACVATFMAIPQGSMSMCVAFGQLGFEITQSVRLSALWPVRRKDTPTPSWQETSWTAG